VAGIADLNDRAMTVFRGLCYDPALSIKQYERFYELLFPSTTPPEEKFMYKILLGLLSVVMAITFVITDAQAKRFGGGKSSGVKHETSSFSRAHSNAGAATSASRTAAAPAAKPAAGASRWLGPLAGLAIGGLLASLFMGNGLASGVMSWLLIAVAAFLVWRLISFFLSRRAATQPMPGMRFQAEPATNHFQAPLSPLSNQTAATPIVEEAQDERIKDFDEEAFLRQGKTLFIRLQAAYDEKNLADIRQFTSPEMQAEIQLQFQERGDAVNFTEVVHIDATLVNLTTDQNGIVASILFSGLVREDKDAAPTDIKEIWNFYNDDVKQNWLIVGIQQA
jgi:predicted lipid-binding transport protein (Tim44 family)